MKKTKCITTILFFAILLSSCAQEESAPPITPAPSLAPFPITQEAAAASTPDFKQAESPAQEEITPKPALPAPESQQRTYLLYSNDATRFESSAFSFYGDCDKKDDTLFQAIYKSLSDTNWTTVSEGANKYKAYLPDEVNVNDFYISEEIGRQDVEVPGYKRPIITKHVREDLNLAYIAIENRDWSIMQENPACAILLLFDIRDGYYAPYGGVSIGISWYGEANSYFITGAGGMRWVVESGLWLSGTGKWREGSEWWNIDERSVDIAYSYEERSELDRAPMGIATFEGYLDKPKLSENPDGNTLRLDFTQSLSLIYNGGESEDDVWKTKEFKKELSLTIWYDIPCRRAFIEDTSTDRWYLGTGRFSSQPIYDLFEDELRLLAEDADDPAASWAKWLFDTSPRDASRDSSRELCEAHRPF